MPGEGLTHGPPANKKQAAVTTGRPINRHSLRDGFHAYTRSPRCPGLIATVACGSSPAGLIPASGDRDHAISPSVPASVRQLRRHVHRIPHPTFVTIAKRPSGSSAGRQE